MLRVGIAAALAACLVVCRLAGAQGIDYTTIADPHLLLLREPAVLAELKLSEEQAARLIQVNHRLDGALFLLRDWPIDKARERLDSLTRQSRELVEPLLSPDQQQRLQQLARRVRGFEALSDARLADELRLSEDQLERLERLNSQFRSDLAELQRRLAAGESKAALERPAEELRTRRRADVLSVLRPEQTRRYALALGDDFDLGQLRQLRFRAPELVRPTGWINSPPLTLRQLRGQVVAIHFFAYG